MGVHEQQPLAGTVLVGTGLAGPMRPNTVLAVRNQAVRA